MGWLVQRSVKIDNLNVELDTADSSRIESGDIPSQPLLFVISTLLPWGMNKVPAKILCKFEAELFQSYTPRRTAIVPVAFAFQGETRWTEIDVWHDYRLASFVIQAHGEGYDGIEFTPSHNGDERTAKFIRWVATGYDSGYWEDAGVPTLGERLGRPVQWDDLEALRSRTRSIIYSAEVEVLPEGDGSYLATTWND